ncbi:hypothetical protein F8388_018996 [Cannabis sativa]|uniref:Reverse transcriptase zinc-binding domain-containing protein n=1 Tax=Cannabis sativa TaxID=3483 RepID=A0A7J6H0U6_CANSA|nr:hypothetical protein F8388_018996 [Cannabis sativa]
MLCIGLSTAVSNTTRTTNLPVVSSQAVTQPLISPNASTPIFVSTIVTATSKICGENGLWSLKIPPKVKVFVWRLYHSALPVASLLVRGKVHDSFCCSRCGDKTGTPEHALVFCSSLVLGWLRLGVLAIEASGLFQLGGGPVLQRETRWLLLLTGLFSLSIDDSVVSVVLSLALGCDLGKSCLSSITHQLYHHDLHFRCLSMILKNEKSNYYAVLNKRRG